MTFEELLEQEKLFGRFGLYDGGGGGGGGGDGEGDIGAGNIDPNDASEGSTVSVEGMNDPALSVNEGVVPGQSNTVSEGSLGPPGAEGPTPGEAGGDVGGGKPVTGEGTTGGTTGGETPLKAEVKPAEPKREPRAKRRRRTILGTEESWMIRAPGQRKTLLGD